MIRRIKMEKNGLIIGFHTHKRGHGKWMACDILKQERFSFRCYHIVGRNRIGILIIKEEHFKPIGQLRQKRKSNVFDLHNLPGLKRHNMVSRKNLHALGKKPKWKMMRCWTLNRAISLQMNLEYSPLYSLCTYISKVHFAMG